MNKQLIKDNFEAFTHWIDGGKVLTLNNRKHNEWELVDHEDFWRNPSNKPIFIVNDRYVKFRKALAEGKTVQFFNTKDRLYDSSKTLNRWHNTYTIHTHGKPEDYRIKPDEPQFKVGDWVVVYTCRGKDNERISKPVQVTNVSSHFIQVNNYKQYAPSYLELWQPKHGEWCWFKTNIDSNVVFGKFVEKLDERYYASNHCSRSDYFKYCEPFIDTLPTFIKEP
jgi:hypothetical protein